MRVCSRGKQLDRVKAAPFMSQLPCLEAETYLLTLRLKDERRATLQHLPEGSSIMGA